MFRAKRQQTALPPATALPPEFEQVVEVLPERDPDDGRYFWQAFAERLQSRFEGAPASDGRGSFVDQCLRAGAKAVPVVRANSRWKKNAPHISERRAFGVYQLRIRLGLFYAASLRSLVQGASRMRVCCGEAVWKPVTEKGESFRDFAARQEREVEVAWSTSAPDIGEVCLLTNLFFTPEEALLLTPELAQEVYKHVCSEGPRGLFGLMLYGEGQMEKVSVDVAKVFLEALVQGVDQKLLRVNTPVNGHVFITPAFWFVTNPVGVGDVVRWLRTRRQARRYDFSRHQVIEALASADCLTGVGVGDVAQAVRVCKFDLAGWLKPLVLNGLPVKVEKVPGIADVMSFGGEFTLRSA